METHSDTQGSRLGMWLFLYTEIMLFTALFILYAAYFKRYPADFAAGGKELSLVFGAINTIILLISSFAVAASITAIQNQSEKLSAGLLGATVIIGGIFLVNKYVEWGQKIHHGIYPNSPDLINGPPGKNIFSGCITLSPDCTESTLLSAWRCCPYVCLWFSPTGFARKMTGFSKIAVCTGTWWISSGFLFFPCSI